MKLAWKPGVFPLWDKRMDEFDLFDQHKRVAEGEDQPSTLEGEWQCPRPGDATLVSALPTVSILSRA